MFYKSGAVISDQFEHLNFLFGEIAKTLNFFVTWAFPYWGTRKALPIFICIVFVFVFVFVSSICIVAQQRTPISNDKEGLAYLHVSFSTSSMFALCI